MEIAGPIFTDITGLTLTDDDRTIIANPLVSGIILFARNYQNKKQLRELTQSIRDVKPDIILCVDQEGGRVQRFKDEFTLIPPMGELGEMYREDANKAIRQAHQYGLIIGEELHDVDVDFSFTPVLDLDYQKCDVIGKRAFARDPHVVAELAGALIDGLAEQGMGCVGKHFPGHGFVALDSHIADPVDERDFDTLWEDDIQPYLELNDKLTAIMTAHIKYPRVDTELVTYSDKWLQEIVRDKMGYEGLIFSDDLCMHAASHDEPIARVQKALNAGCDLVLLCNDREVTKEVLENFN